MGEILLQDPVHYQQMDIAASNAVHGIAQIKCILSESETEIYCAILINVTFIKVTLYFAPSTETGSRLDWNLRASLLDAFRTRSISIIEEQVQRVLDTDLLPVREQIGDTEALWCRTKYEFPKGVYLD
jgi:hypothetical protein